MRYTPNIHRHSWITTKKYSQLKVLHIITGLGLGGAEGVLKRLLLAENRNEHYVISLTAKSYYSDILHENGITVYHLNMQSHGFSFRSIKELRGLMKKIDPDVIQTWMYHANVFAGMAAFFLRKKLYWNLRATYQPRTNNFVFNWLVRLSVILSYFVPDKVICCSKSVAVNHDSLGYASKKLIVIDNGFDTDLLKRIHSLRKAKRDTLRLDMECLVFGMAARYHPQKDYLTLLDAFAMFKQKNPMKKFFLLLAGKDIDKDNHILVTYINERGLEKEVRLLGIQNIVEFMNSIDVYISSSAYGEGFPNVLAEAMACEVPCITTDIGEAKDIVKDVGWVVPARQPEVMSRVINDVFLLSNDKKVWKQYEQKAREIIVAKYGLQFMVERYCKVWSS